MTKPARHAFPGCVQHVLQRGLHRQPTFFSGDDYRAYLECLRQAGKEHGCDIHAYVLMPNHVHLLVTPRAVDGVAALMQSLRRGYRPVAASGTSPWEDRCQASVLHADEHILACHRYIEQGPVRAGLVPEPAEYPWSSYHWHALGQRNKLITDHGAYQALGAAERERQAVYRKLAARALDERRLQDMRALLNEHRVTAAGHIKPGARRAPVRTVTPGDRGGRLAKTPR